MFDFDCEDQLKFIFLINSVSDIWIAFKTTWSANNKMLCYWNKKVPAILELPWATFLWVKVWKKLTYMMLMSKSTAVMKNMLLIKHLTDIHNANVLITPTRQHGAFHWDIPWWLFICLLVMRSKLTPLYPL